MRALQLCCRSGTSAHHCVTNANLYATLSAFRRCFASTAEAADTAQDTEDHHLTNDNSFEDSDTPETPQDARKPLEATLLRYIYSPDLTTPDTRLLLPQRPQRLQRIQRAMDVEDASELMKTIEAATLNTEEECAHYINLVVAYVRHENNRQQQRAGAVALRKQTREGDEATYFLSLEEQQALVGKALTLIEQRRVPLVVASRLLEFQWPSELRSHGGSTRQRYAADLVRNWIADDLQSGTLTPRDARAVLTNCATAFKTQMQYARLHHRKTAGKTSAESNRGAAATTKTTAGNERMSAMEAQLMSLVGSLATTAMQDATTPRHLEGLIAIMWNVQASGCPAPASFWDEMVQRVVHLNSALESQSFEVADDEGSSEMKSVEKDQPGKASHRPQGAGHFFSTLTTRQIYRFLLVLKTTKWAGDATVLHQVADQALRNIAFELEATQFNTDAESKVSEDGPKSSDTADGRTSVKPSTPAVSFGAFSPPFESFSNKASATSSLVPATQMMSKREVTRCIRRVADLRPREFLELLSLCADLRVSFGVSATRVSAELLTPLIPHLPTKDLLTLLETVRHTQSQSTVLLQAVMQRLVQSGPAIPYALALSKTLIRTAATAPEVFATLEMEDFVGFFLDLCEAQGCLCRPTVVTGLGELLYLLGRRYEEDALPGQRIRATVNVLCAHLDRLLQLQVLAPAAVERLLEVTVLLRMRPHPERYPAMAELLKTRAVVVNQKEARLAASQERRLRYVDAAAAATVADAAAPGEDSAAWSGRAPRWEDLPEQALPTLPKAALLVYREIAYMFERMVVVRARLTRTDFDTFERSMRRAGLYSLLQGVQLFQHGHLAAQVTYTTESARRASEVIPHTLPRWMEKTINGIVLRKIDSIRVTQQSTDDEVLRLLGHVHCDAAKVDAVIAVIVQSPLQMVKRQRALWLYVRELARRFGSAETQKAVDTYLSKSLF